MLGLITRKKAIDFVHSKSRYFSSQPADSKVTVMMLPIFPLLLLVTSIGSGIWYQKTDNDIFGVLAVASAAACLVWGLVIAHWSIHLLGLLFLFKLRKPMLGFVQINK
jgi:hypothetical protein